MGLSSDFRVAVRSLLKYRGFTVIAVLTLAIGVGANTAIFSMADAIYLRPLPVPEPDRIVRLFTSDRTGGHDVALGSFSFPDFEDLRHEAPAFSRAAVYANRGGIVEVGGEQQLVLVTVTSPGYFAVAGIPAALGRFPSEADLTRADAPSYVVLSDGAWRRRLGADPAIVGKTIRITHHPCVVAAVAPASFRGLDLHLAPEVWMTVQVWSRLARSSAPDLTARDRRYWSAFARLPGGVDVGAARAELDVVASRLAREHPATNSGRRMTVLRERDTRSQGLVSEILFFLAALLLLLASANVVTLILARAEGRKREVALRQALGAGRGAIARLVAIEVAALALLASFTAVVLARWVIGMLPAFFPPTVIPLGYDFRVGTRALLFTALATLGAAFFTAVLPTSRAGRADIFDALNARPTSGRAVFRRWTPANALTIAQLAISLALVTATVLLLRTLWNFERIDPGFRSDMSAALVTVAPGAADYGPARTREYYRAVVERARAVPGVADAALTMRVPLSPTGGGASKTVFITGVTPPEGIGINYDIVDDRCLNLLGTTLLAGRGFTVEDREGAPPVAIVNETMARKYWNGTFAIGQRIRIGSAEGPEHEIVGIVRDGKYVSLDEAPKPYLFFPLGQQIAGEVTLVARTTIDPAAAIPTLRAAVHGAGPEAAMIASMTMEQHASFALYQQRMAAMVVGILGAMGLALAAVGLYGEVSYEAKRRTREVGVRIALGATPSEVLRVVVYDGLVLSFAGAAVGVVAGYAVAQAIRGMLFGVSPNDPTTFVIASAVLVAVSVAASAIPAIAAIRTNPVEALRVER